MLSYIKHLRNIQETLDSLPKDQVIPALRYLCRTDLFFLIRIALNRPDMEHQWLFERCLEVQENPDNHLDLWSREHYKSTIITFGKTIQDILASHGDGALVEREVTVGLFSHTRPIAKDFLKQIKRELEGNERLLEWFPDILYKNPSREAPKWSEDEGIIVRRKSNPRESTVEAWGLVDSQPIGKHFSLLVYDDVVTRESVNTPEMISKTMEMLELSYNLGARGGSRRFIGTRYHFNDPYATLIARGTVAPRIKPATEDGTFNGNPVFLTKEALIEKRRDMGEYTFSCQMLQNPVADETQGFKREWLRFHDGMVENTSGMNIYIVVDPANSKRKYSDYTSMWVIGLGFDQNFYVIDMVRDRLNLNQRVRQVMDWHLKYKPVRNGGVRYEKYGMMADIEALKSLMEQENYRFDVTEVGGQSPKEDRIRRLMSPLEQGRFYFPRTLYYTGYDGKTKDLIQVFIEEEYRAFPVSKHDDMLDSLSRIMEPDLPLSWPKTQHNRKSAFRRFVDSEYKIFG